MDTDRISATSVEQQHTIGLSPQASADSLMSKQASFFGTATLTRPWNLAGPPSLSKRERRSQEEQSALGGMRRPDLSVQQSPKYREVGSRLRLMLEDMVSRHDEARSVIEAIRNGSPTQGFSKSLLRNVRKEWLSTLHAPASSPVEGPDASVFAAWGKATDDPDAANILPAWITEGAPMGILREIPLSNVFPPCDNASTRTPESVHSELAGWSNYKSAEDAPDVVGSLLEDQEAKGHCMFFSSYEELLEYLGESEVVLSKLALISKERPDGSTKYRLRTRLLAIAALALAALGFPLAWSKAVAGSNVTWIGAQMSIVTKGGRAMQQRHATGVRVSIPDSKWHAVAQQTSNLKTAKVISKRILRSYCGSVSFIAGMLAVLRPFLSMLWAALSSTGRLPPSLVHPRQCRVPLEWLEALFREVHGPLARTFPIASQPFDEGSYIATDACPWGFAGVKYESFQAVAWFATPLSVEDLRRFRASVGDPAFNTTWEALALLVAMRIWLPGSTVVACVRSDSLSALRSMVKLSSSSPALNLIAREMALDSVMGLYTLDLATHIPGVSNVLADDLSRLWAPDRHDFPTALVGVPEVVAPHRGGLFWRTTAPSQRGGQKRRRK